MAQSKTQDAIELLSQDHREVEQLFEQFDRAEDDNHRMAVAEQICLMLKVHSQLEEELFYPAVRSKIEDKELVEEALTEHQEINELVAQIETAEAGDRQLQSRIEALEETVDRHVQVEETEIFPEAQKAKVDLAAIGEKLAQRKPQLMQEYGAEMREETRGERAPGGERPEARR